MKHQEYSGIGNAIRARRDELGISAAELARRVGVYPSSITRLEAGEVGGRLNNIRDIAAALKMPLTELLAESHVIDEHDLPQLTPYLRTKYKNMPEAAVKEIERHFQEVAKRHGISPNSGPSLGQDE
ncbi:helix-turn-helix domain-containing protein [Arthrobacter sp. CJ23]|uniref:helix-turn-helix domain-containing protein n=1 Tax=Arthrobacter sp. CJ23 TaxID=2972479 RepID=UPI00215B840D|nr:helix-turn-helix transcriptional regulator [Arthrobacter sp. CJ23]UVJ38069.1 helix-turn-helix domain-containing protein [Arthrobacter sp. CJ23]